MKKKFLLTILSLVCVIACIFGLVACGGNENNDTDKSFQNTEFVSYRKKIVTIMKNSGIFVNDLDANQDVKTHNQKMTATAAAFAVSFSDKARSANTITDIMVKPEYLADSEGFDFLMKQVFGITLGMSLCIGDGISNYFNETSFFDIAVKLADNTYLRVTEEGNTDTVWVYSNNSGVQYEKIDVIYNGGNDYSFNYIQVNDNQKMYFYGSSNKELLVLEMGQNTSVLYTPDGKTFYSTYDNISAANACYDILGHNIFDIQPTDFSKMEKDYKYTFTAEQFKVLQDKYFKDIQTSINPDTPRGIQYEDINGKQVATCYIAEDGETEAVIPEDVKYLSSQFYVGDNKGTVKSIAIPASVEAFIDQDGNTVTDYRQVRFTLLNYVTDKEQFFNEITVEAGSPLFKEGKGHLTVAENDFIIAIVDQPMDTLDFNVLAAAFLHKDEGQISRLFKVNNGKNLTIPQNFFEMQEKYGVDFLEALEQTIYNTDPDEINVNYTDSSNLPKLKLRLSKDLIINAVCGGDVSNNGDSLGIYFTLENVSADKRSVVLNVDKKLYGALIEIGPVQPEHIKDDNDPSTWLPPEYVCDDTIFTAVNMPIPEDLYSFLYANPQSDYKRIVRDEKNSTVNFMPSTQGNKFDYLNVHNTYGDDRVTVTIKNDVPENTVINIPEKFYDFNVFDILIPENAVKTKSIKIIVSQNVIINFENDIAQFNNPNFVLKYNGTFEELKGRFSNYYLNENCDVQFTAECLDKTEIIKIGWKYNDDNEDNYLYSASIKYNGETKTIKFKFPGAVSINLFEYWTLQDGYAYYLFDKEGNRSKPEYNPEDGNLVASLYITADYPNEYTLQGFAFGLRTLELKGDGYSIKASTFFEQDCQLKITEGTVGGYTVFIETSADNDVPPDISDWEKFNRLQGINCSLFNEFELPLQTDDGNSFIRVKFILNDSGEIEFVVCEKIYFDVTVNLYDGSKLNYNLKFNERIPFDEQTWKIEDGYAYYIAAHNYDGDLSYPLQLENGTIYRYSENIELKRIRLFDNLPVSLSGDSYNVTGLISLQKGGDAFSYNLAWEISGTVNGFDFTSRNTINSFWQGITDYVNIADVNEDNTQWNEYIEWTILTEVDENGALSAAGFDYEMSLYFHTNNKDMWSVTINGEKAHLNYNVMGDDGMPDADYDIIDIENIPVRELSDEERNNAVQISREIYDSDGKVYTETLFMYVHKITADDGSLTFEYVSYKKEVVAV